ncbi:MAG: RNA-binding S4 domain-containing protein [Bacteroides sp.]
MPRTEFSLEGTEYIELIRLLKYVGIAKNGGHAQELVVQGAVLRNGMPELRKRAKLRAGDLIRVGEDEILIKA